MAQFNCEQFVADPDLELLEQLTKDQLIPLGQYLGLSVRKALRKQEIVTKIIQELVRQELIDESAATASGSDSTAMQLELKK